MPLERQSALHSIASALWSVAWKFEGGVGTAPPLDTLNTRNQRRWLGAALAAEHLMAQAKQDSVQQTAVINGCIRTLEEYRDSIKEVKIA